MNRYSCFACGTVLLLLLVATAPAASFTWDAGGANDIWNTALNWSNDAVPSAGNTYTVDGAAYTMRSLDAAADTFPGASLTVTNGARFLLFRTNGGGAITSTHTYTNLTIDGAKLDPASSNGSLNHNFPNQIELLGANSMNFASGGGFTNTMNLNGGVTGSGSVNVTRSSQGSGRSLTLNGDNSGYSGNWTISSSASEIMTFQVNSNSGWGTGNVSLGNFGALVINANVTANSSVISLTDPDARVTVNGGKTVSVGAISSAVASSLTLNGSLATGANNLNSSFAGLISGAGNFTKVGTGIVTLSNAASSYSGLNTVAQGTLAFTAGDASATANQPLGTNDTIDLGVAATSSGTLRYSGSGATTLDKNITALGNGADTIENSGTGLLTLTGVITKDGVTLTLKGGANGILITDTGTITGASANSDLVVDGGPVTLNSANTYNGPTYIVNGGSLTANVTDALPTSPARSAILMDQSGTGSSSLDLGADQFVRSLTGAVSSSVNLNNNTLTVGDAAAVTTFAGVISGNGGSLTKDNSSTQVLTGANTYSGATTVTGGTLQLADGGLENASIAVNATGTFRQTAGTNHVTGGAGTGNLTISNSGVYRLQGGTLDFGDYLGAGSAWTPNNASTLTTPSGAQFEFSGGSLYDVSTITVGDGSAFTQSGGNFFIGRDGAGPAAVTTINGGYSLVAGVLHLDAFGLDPTPEVCCDGVASLNDQLTVLGNVTLDSVVSLDYIGFTPQFGDVFTLICADTISVGDGFALTGGYFRVVPTGNLDGPAYALQAIVPEPASVALWSLIGLVGAAGLTRAHRQRQPRRGESRRQTG